MDFPIELHSKDYELRIATTNNLDVIVHRNPTNDNTTFYAEPIEGRTDYRIYIRMPNNAQLYIVYSEYYGLMLVHVPCIACAFDICPTTNALFLTGYCHCDCYINAFEEHNLEWDNTRSLMKFGGYNESSEGKPLTQALLDSLIGKLAYKYRDEIIYASVLEAK